MNLITCPACRTKYDRKLLKCSNCGEWRPEQADDADDNFGDSDEVAPHAEPAPVLRPVARTTKHEPKVSVEAVGGRLPSGVEQFKELNRLGYQLVAVVGLSQHGKTDFIRSMITAVVNAYGGDTGQQLEVMDAAGMTERTAPGTYNAWKIQAGSQLVAVWDIAGEDFQKIGNRGDLDGDIARFLSHVLPMCQGVIMTMSLYKIWDLWNQAPDEQPSADEFRTGLNLYNQNLNTYVRFLQFAQLLKGTSSEIALELLTDPAAMKAALAKRARVKMPIVVNFSQADLYPGIRTPNGVTPPIELHDLMVLPSIELSPGQQDPRALAYLYLDPLFKHVREHVRSAHYVYSIGHAGGKERSDRYSARCLEPFELITGLGWPLPCIDSFMTERYYHSEEWKSRVEAISGVAP